MGEREGWYCPGCGTPAPARVKACGCPANAVTLYKNGAITGHDFPEIGELFVAGVVGNLRQMLTEERPRQRLSKWAIQNIEDAVEALEELERRNPRL